MAVLYIERWLKAPVWNKRTVNSFRARRARRKELAWPSPLLANLFLHYAFDRWMTVNFPQVPFERYADDAIVHCRTEKQAQMSTEGNCEAVVGAVDWNSIRRRRGSSIARMRFAKGKNTPMRSSIFLASNSDQGSRSITQRKSLRQFQSSGLDQSSHVDAGDRSGTGVCVNAAHQSLEDLSRLYNPIIRGWFQYHGRYYRTALYSVIPPTGRRTGQMGQTEIQEAAQS